MNCESDQLGSQIEALLIVAEEPISAAVLAEALRTPIRQINEKLLELARFYD